jgi:Zn-dependent peptidase ImmA (M78 family)
MKVFHPYGSKARLFEMMGRVNRLNEEILSKEEKLVIINDFLKYIDEQLSLSGDLPEVKISYDSSVAQTMKSFGKYTPDTNELLVVAANRNLADVLRTIAHEIIHHKQNKSGKLQNDSNNTGSDIENEANALAGVFMREFAKNNPIIFE